MKQSSIITLGAFLVATVAVMVVVADVSHLENGPPPGTNLEPVTEICLGCICTAVSGCKKPYTCNGDVCGLLRITNAYWVDANKPVLGGDSPSNPSAFETCVNEPRCAARTVQQYMAKFQQDCNGDGQINCYDHAAIHIHGAYGCNGPLPDAYKRSLEQCLSQAQNFQG